jgi:hypothetical protein
MKSISVTVEEHIRGDTHWVALRARGAEWSWLTPAEAAEVGRLLVEKYGLPAKSNSVAVATERYPRLVHAT